MSTLRQHPKWKETTKTKFVWPVPEHMRAEESPNASTVKWLPNRSTCPVQPLARQGGCCYTGQIIH